MMPVRYLTLLIIALLLSWQPVFGDTESTIPWKTPTFSYTARQAPVAEVLMNFATAQGIGLNLPDGLKLVISGNFHERPSQKFLEEVCASCNLIWYYDGAGLYICTPGQMQSVLLELRYMKADDVIEILRELDVEDPRFPMARTKDNALIKISGPPRYVELIQELVIKADNLHRNRLARDEEIRIFRLKHAWANDVDLGSGDKNSNAGVTVRGVAGILQELMGVNHARTKLQTKEQQASDKKPEDMTADEKAKDEMERISNYAPQILADSRLNAVIVRDSKARMPYYEQLIQELDVPIRMVEIAVTILDIDKSALLDWELRLKGITTKKKYEAGAGLDVDNLASPATLTGLGLTGALSYINNTFSLASSIAALEEKGKARTISRPSILTLDNVTATLQDTKSYHAKVVGKEVVDLTQVTTGIILTVQPRIVDLPQQEIEEGMPMPPSYEIWMSLKIQDGDFETVVVDDLPMSHDSTLETQAGVQEGQCLLIGGYMHESVVEKAWGIPFLRSIPWIGWLFGGIGKDKSIMQRMFLLSPRMIVFNHLSSDPVESSVKHRDVTIESDIQDEFRRRDHQRDVDEQERDQIRKEEEEEWRQEEKQRIKERREALKRQKQQLKKEMEEQERNQDQNP
ncbi:MAG: type III secretion system outer membrane ring subunit SctC [Victivallales bacterium]|nr:type III secretion system outer membrane ring subunit SctC [Victivallales bacterium]